jgi:hypothetical protein
MLGYDPSQPTAIDPNLRDTGPAMILHDTGQINGILSMYPLHFFVVCAKETIFLQQPFACIRIPLLKDSQFFKQRFIHRRTFSCITVSRHDIRAK